MTLNDDYMTWQAFWLTLLAIAVGIGVVILTRVARDSWRQTGARLDEGMAKVLNGDPMRTATNCDLGAHPGPWSRYATYGIWLCCGQREDQPQPQPHQCRITGCHKPATHLFDRPSTTGIFYTCTTHAAAVREWAGPYDQPVFDQDLAPGTDLNLWDREVGA